MDKEQDLLEELRLRAAALVEAKEKADDKEDEDDMEDDEDEIEDGDEDCDKEKNESEELDELSKSTLGSYVKKSSNSAANLATTAMHLKNTANMHANASPKADLERAVTIRGEKRVLNRDVLAADYHGYSKDATDKQNKRLAGVRKATDRLTKESEEIDELSKTTLGSYVKKAGGSVAKHATSAEHNRSTARDIDNHRPRDQYTGDLRSDWQATHDDKLAAAKKSSNIVAKRRAGIGNAISKLTKESEEVDMSIESLFEGQDLSEEFKIKVTALFEAAVAQKVSAIEESYAVAMEEFEAEVSQTALTESEEVVEGLVERVDGYLDYMVEQWIENNEIALERGIKADLFESFMVGMKGLFEEHMINVPEDKIEVLESQQAEIEELESKVDSVLAENVELKQTLKEIVKQNQIMEAAEGLSEVEMERFVELAEELAYDNEEVFGKKLNVIREQFFSNTDASKQLVESVAATVVTDEPLVEEVEMPKRALTEEVDPSIAALAARISRKSY